MIGKLHTRAKAPAARTPALTPAYSNLLRQKLVRHGSPAVERDCRAPRENGLKLRRQSDDSRGPRTAPPIVHEVLRSGGQPLDPAARAFMETRFGYDFGSVRVHTGSLAARSAESVAARAYAVGPHLVFGSGGYAPASCEGQRLLAHELTHVVQQGGAAALAPAHLAVGAPGDRYEQNADQVATEIMRMPQREATGVAPQTGHDFSLASIYSDSGGSGSTRQPGASASPLGPRAASGIQLAPISTPYVARDSCPRTNDKRDCPIGDGCTTTDGKKGTCKFWSISQGCFCDAPKEVNPPSSEPTALGMIGAAFGSMLGGAVGASAGLPLGVAGMGFGLKEGADIGADVGGSAGDTVNEALEWLFGD